MSRAKILIVEDEFIIAKELQKILESYEFNVCEICRTGNCAMEAVEKHRPDLILMDILLSGDRDGIAVGEDILSSRDIPLIFITAHSDSEYIDRLKKINPNGFILKPFNEKELMLIVELNLVRHRSKIELMEKERYFRETLDQLPVIVCLTNTVMDVVYLNQMGREYFGEDYREQNFYDLCVVEDELKRLKSDIKRIIDGNVSVSSGYRIRHHDQENAMLVNLSGITDQGVLSGFRFSMLPVKQSIIHMLKPL